MFLRRSKINCMTLSVPNNLGGLLSHTRQLHQQVPACYIPAPTPFVPDPKTFLTLIGRNLAQHATKFPNWESLFSLTSTQLRDLGIEPARNRRYLLWWRNKFCNGEHGVGGDLQFVTDGTAELRVVDVPKSRSENDPATILPSSKKLVVNLPPGSEGFDVMATKAKEVKGLKVRGAHTIIGPYVKAVKGSNGSLVKIGVQEGMWEQRRGHKVDGGERRKAEVRAKRRIEEKRNSRT